MVGWFVSSFAGCCGLLISLVFVVVVVVVVVVVAVAVAVAVAAGAGAAPAAAVLKMHDSQATTFGSIFFNKW